jgi:hypothetical protein
MAQPVASADSQGRGNFDMMKWLEIYNIFSKLVASLAAAEHGVKPR